MYWDQFLRKNLVEYLWAPKCFSAGDAEGSEVEGLGCWSAGPFCAKLQYRRLCACLLSRPKKTKRSCEVSRCTYASSSPADGSGVTLISELGDKRNSRVPLEWTQSGVRALAEVSRDLRPEDVVATHGKQYERMS